MTDKIIVKVLVFPLRGEPHVLMYDEHAVHQYAGLAEGHFEVIVMMGRTKAYFYAEWPEGQAQPKLLEEAPAQSW